MSGPPVLARESLQSLNPDDRERADTVVAAWRADPAIRRFAVVTWAYFCAQLELPPDERSLPPGAYALLEGSRFMGGVIITPNASPVDVLNTERQH